MLRSVSSRVYRYGRIKLTLSCENRFCEEVRLPLHKIPSTKHPSQGLSASEVELRPLDTTSELVDTM